MGVESNGVMHKKWIRNERKTEDGEWEGEGWLRRQEEPRRRENAKHFSFGARPVNSILEHDAECLKYLTSAEVKKNLHNASLLTSCADVPFIIHAASKTLVASSLFVTIFCANC